MCTIYLYISRSRSALLTGGYPFKTGTQVRWINSGRPCLQLITITNAVFIVQGLCARRWWHPIDRRTAAATAVEGAWLLDASRREVGRCSNGKPLPLMERFLSSAGTCRWHLGDCSVAGLPTNRGFDSFLGILSGAADHYTQRNVLLMSLPSHNINIRN